MVNCSQYQYIQYQLTHQYNWVPDYPSLMMCQKCFHYRKSWLKYQEQNQLYHKRNLCVHFSENFEMCRSSSSQLGPQLDSLGHYRFLLQKNCLKKLRQKISVFLNVSMNVNMTFQLSKSCSGSCLTFLFSNEGYP